ncbi:MAG: CinA family protein [Burkholderiaceae bacterium]|jgi:nicotinamide-nucleotide amidase
MDDETLALAKIFGQRLLERRRTFTCAESCTGGMLAAAITDVAGSSGWFERGFVTYSNESKMEMLGVSEELLKREGAVSEATARAMAEGALAHSRADLAVSITGIAGPGGAVPGKPVGTVCFAVTDRTGPAQVQTRHFDGDRAAVRRAATRFALQSALAWLAQH